MRSPECIPYRPDALLSARGLFKKLVAKLMHTCSAKIVKSDERSSYRIAEIILFRYLVSLIEFRVVVMIGKVTG